MYSILHLLFHSIPVVISACSVKLDLTGGYFQKDKILNKIPMLDICNIGPKKCVKECMVHYGCYAVNYDGKNLHCELLNDAGPYYDLSYREGMRFSKINGGWMQDENSCWPNPCTGRTTCETTYNNKYICLPYDLQLNTDRFSCGFEPDTCTKCVFQDSKLDDFDWTRHHGNTSSVATGPYNAADGLYYIYTEVSNPRIYGDIAVLTTEAADLQAITWCLSFNYHMKGDPGKLEVFAGDKSSPLTSVWVKTGMQPNQDQWKTAIIDIPQFSNTVINIEGVRGLTYDGDIAIDYITLNAGACKPKR